jgi:hypothetical protein
MQGGLAMRRILKNLMALACLSFLATGCSLVQPSADLTVDEPRCWMNDQPDHLTPYRVHGGVGPAASSP